MKIKLNLIVLPLLLFLSTTFCSKNTTAQGYASYQVFYDELSPYGNWVNNANYGYVWIPNVEAGFSPYATNGYWLFTEDGWTWVSNYSWGWAPFHYGRWFNDPMYGAMWVPGTEWGPGWVTWRKSESYYGWAPLGPGISIEIGYSNNYFVPNHQWTFVKDRDLGRKNINNYFVNAFNNVTIINNSTVINNRRVNKVNKVTYNAGPAQNEVEKRIGNTITAVSIRERSKPGENLVSNQLQIYRPQMKKNISAEKKSHPLKVVGVKELRIQGNAAPQKEKSTERPQKSESRTEEKKEVNPQDKSPMQPENSPKAVEGPPLQERTTTNTQQSPMQPDNAPIRRENEEQKETNTPLSKLGGEAAPPKRRESTNQPPQKNNTSQKRQEERVRHSNSEFQKTGGELSPTKIQPKENKHEEKRPLK